MENVNSESLVKTDKYIDPTWTWIQDVRHEEIKDTPPVAIILRRLRVGVRQEAQADRRSGTKESVSGVYIRRAVASTFPGASMHVDRQRPLPVRYLHGTPRTNLTRSGVVRTPTQRTRNSSYVPLFSLSLSFSLDAIINAVLDPWDWKESVSLRPCSRYVRDVTMSVTSFPEYPAPTARRKLGR